MFLRAASARSAPTIGYSTSEAGRGAALERFNTTNPIVAIDLEPGSPAGGTESDNVTVLHRRRYEHALW